MHLSTDAFFKILPMLNSTDAFFRLTPQFPAGFLEGSPNEQQHMKKIKKSGNMNGVWDHARFYLRQLGKDRFKESTINEIWWEIGNDNAISKRIA